MTKTLWYTCPSEELRNPTSSSTPWTRENAYKQHFRPSRETIILRKPSRNKYKLYVLWMETWQRPYDTRVPRKNSGIPRVLPPLGREKMHISNIFVPQGRPLSSGNQAGINISFMCCGWKHDKDPMIHVSLGRTQESHEFFHPLDERKCI